MHFTQVLIFCVLPVLGVVQHRLRVVRAPAGPVRRTGGAGPSPEVRALVPGLGEGEERRVDQAADGQVRELV